LHLQQGGEKYMKRWGRVAFAVMPVFPGNAKLRRPAEGSQVIFHRKTGVFAARCRPESRKKRPETDFLNFKSIFNFVSL
jgi:hypothetical protein